MLDAYELVEPDAIADAVVALVEDDSLSAHTVVFDNVERESG